MHETSKKEEIVTSSYQPLDLRLKRGSATQGRDHNSGKRQAGKKEGRKE